MSTSQTNDNKENHEPSQLLSPISEAQTPGLPRHERSSDQTMSEPSHAGDVKDDCRESRLQSPVIQPNEQKANTILSPASVNSDAARKLKLSPKQIKDLTTSPGSLPVRAATPTDEELNVAGLDDSNLATQSNGNITVAHGSSVDTDVPSLPSVKLTPGNVTIETRGKPSRSTSSPVLPRKQSSHSRSRPPLPPLKLDASEHYKENGYLEQSGRTDRTDRTDGKPSPLPVDLPIPPLSLPTYLQLELSTTRPSPLYIHHNPNHDFPYEPSHIKFERLLNFFRLPPQLELVLWFGTLACLDSWLYTFTILPLRFATAIQLFLRWCMQNGTKELRDISAFVFDGVGRIWRRRQSNQPDSGHTPVSEISTSPRPSFSSRSNSAISPALRSPLPVPQSRRRSGLRHKRVSSTPSSLLPSHKADILQGLLVVLSCVMLMWLDASRMYHSIRGQAAIKLYVIYNVLEVFDRLFSALGQDVLECLFSKDTLERGADGRSKILRPLWMFVLALAYNVIHATALFYQLVTLNVAVNSYSNALLTLLMSNQFVEIKGTVFKKFEKENLFQLTCADIVERFQLWLMLLIIAVRNIVEVGGFSISLNVSSFSGTANANASTNASTSSFVVPDAFKLMPAWTGDVIGPFLIVLGSEMLVDWLKHAYITKFNNVKPNIYGRFLDVLTKDYYTHAFADQNLTKRLGLPVIPLSCLFIRASMQTYHMFLATHVPAPMTSTATAVSLDTEAVTTPATVKALQHIDHVFRRALGRSTFGSGNAQSDSLFTWWSLDDTIALATMVTFFLALYLLLLAFKLILGMVLLSYSRNRYRSMKLREHSATDSKGKRVGGWGVVEVGDDKRRWIYEDDKDGLRDLQTRESRSRSKAEKSELNLDNVDRYAMAAKRIW